MNSSEVKVRLKEVGDTLNSNESRRKVIKPLLAEAQKTFKEYQDEMVFLESQWNRFVADERTMKLDLQELEGRETLLMKEQEYIDAYKGIEDFYEFMKPLLQKWINHNERKYFIVKPSYTKIVDRMKVDLVEYAKPHSQPTRALAELTSLQSTYNAHMKEIKRLEVDKPKDMDRAITLTSNRINMYFNQYFSGRSFKESYLTVQN